MHITLVHLTRYSSLDAVSDPPAFLKHKHPIVFSRWSERFQAAEAVRLSGISERVIVSNWAPEVEFCVAALLASEKDKDAVLALLPSGTPLVSAKVLEVAAEFARQERRIIVLVEDRPNNGWGLANIEHNSGVYSFDDHAPEQIYLRLHREVYVVKADHLLAMSPPQTQQLARELRKAAEEDKDFIRLPEGGYSSESSIPVRTAHLLVHRVEVGLLFEAPLSLQRTIMEDRLRVVICDVIDGKNVPGCELHKGIIHCTQRALANASHCSPSTINDRLERLRDSGAIKFDTNSLGTRIKLLKSLDDGDEPGDAPPSAC